MNYLTRRYEIQKEWEAREDIEVDKRNRMIQREINDLKKETFKNLFDMMNGGFYSKDVEIMMNVWHSEHRTLQQKFFSSFVIPLIKNISELDSKYFDGRNQDTKDLCDAIVEKCGDNMYLRYI